MTQDELVDIRQDLMVPEGEIKVVVLLGEGASITDEVGEAMNGLREAIEQANESELAGFTIFRVSQKEPAVVVREPTNSDWFNKWAKPQ